MSFSELAKKRYSVRKFKDEKVPEDIIKKILYAGYIAPTGKNNQPQRILVIESDEAVAKLKECTRCHFDAPCAMLVCYNRDECWYRPYDNAGSGEVDASIVTTHMMLEAAELGIGTTWVMHFNPEKMSKAFSIPENIIPVSLLVMGYAADDAQPAPRHDEFRDESELVVYNEFK